MAIDSRTIRTSSCKILAQYVVLTHNSPILSNIQVQYRIIVHVGCRFRIRYGSIFSFILMAHTELDVGLPARLDVGIVPGNTCGEGEGHGEKIVDVERPFVRKQVTVLHDISFTLSCLVPKVVPCPSHTQSHGISFEL
jgi:hypothetical protein